MLNVKQGSCVYQYFWFFFFDLNSTRKSNPDFPTRCQLWPPHQRAGKYGIITFVFFSMAWVARLAGTDKRVKTHGLNKLFVQNLLISPFFFIALSLLK